MATWLSKTSITTATDFAGMTAPSSSFPLSQTTREKSHGLECVASLPCAVAGYNHGVAREARPRTEKMTSNWLPAETAPESGTFLIAVFEGDWDNPYRDYRVYEAFGTRDIGPRWGKSYRTEEGEAYRVAGWMPRPDPPPRPEPPPQPRELGVKRIAGWLQDPKDSFRRNNERLTNEARAWMARSKRRDSAE
jgi:hypothetical protein